MKANELFQAIFCKSKIPDTVSVTYSELMSLMNNSRLIPKTKYRITDYTSAFDGTTSIPNIGSSDYVTATVTSKGIPFDIIVTANTENTLCEDCSAARNVNDNGYFASSRLEEWKLKYTPVVVTEENGYTEILARWVPETSKGFIYYMRDEFGNEAPFDFKNLVWSIEDTQYPVFGNRIDSLIVDGSINGSFCNNVIKNGKDTWFKYNYPIVRIVASNYVRDTSFTGSITAFCSSIYDSVIENTGPDCENYHTVLEGNSINSCSIKCNASVFWMAFYYIESSNITAIAPSKCTCDFSIGGVEMRFTHPITIPELPSELEENNSTIPFTLYTDSFYSATIVRVKNGEFITYQFTQSAGEWTKRTITAQ